MTQQNNIVLADEWFDNAANALGYAKTGLPDTSFYGWICFLCHQSAELYLKGYLVLDRVKPPKIHDLTKLLELAVKQERSLESLLPGCKILNRYYIAVRYPPELRNVDKIEAQAAVELAAAIEAAITELRRKAR
jgi:HEPN domain-containing protein